MDDRRGPRLSSSALMAPICEDVRTHGLTQVDLSRLRCFAAKRYNMSDRADLALIAIDKIVFIKLKDLCKIFLIFKRYAQNIRISFFL